MGMSCDFNQLLQLDSTETLVLTVNNRFARRLLGQLQHSLLGQKKAMAVPDIMPFSAWLRQVNDDLTFSDSQAPAAYLLDSFSRLYVWEQVIYEQEPEQSLLIDVPQAAKMAAEADQLIDEWGLRVEPEAHTGDSARFMQWRQAYRAHLEQHDLDDVNRATERVAQALEAGDYIPTWRHVVLVGFHEISPRLQRMLDALLMHGVRYYFYRAETRDQTHCERIQTSSPDAEWRLAARWAAQQLRENPQGSYAIVALELEQQAAFAHRVLAHELAPRTAGDKSFAWNIAVGRPLGQWPLVRAALNWLTALTQVHAGEVRGATMGAALLSGYCVGAQAEKSQRARLDVLWRTQQKNRLDLEQLDEAIQNCEQLGVAWCAVRDYLKGLTTALTVSQWVPHLRELLRLLGFPGDVSLDSHNYQAMKAFDQRLTQFGRLAPIFGALTLTQVVQMLTRFMHETLFQPQRDASARLDVLGLLEAEGGRWDAIWVIGVTDQVLPATPSPNPFIPYAVLRAAQAPRSTPERELQWARGMFQALQNATPHLICSYACQDNGQALRPSPLIEGLPEQVCPDPLTTTTSKGVRLVQLDDHQGPPVQKDEKIYGGTAVLDRQARNPLWAFVNYRLHAQRLAEYEDSGQLRLVRGTFLHLALEYVWQAISPRTSAQLHQEHQAGRLGGLIESAIDKAAAQTLFALPAVIKQLECQRAKQVLTSWFELETERAPFEVVALEQKHHLPGFAATMRVDRIDRLEDGSYLLVDYKTTKVNKNYTAWLRARPIELQLPIYAALLETQNKAVAGLAFGFLHYACALGGYGDDQAPLTDTETKQFSQQFRDWDELKQHLQTQVWALKDEFLQGVARNQVTDPNDLRYCDVLPFLRLEQEYEQDET